MRDGGPTQDLSNGVWGSKLSSTAGLYYRLLELSTDYWTPAVQCNIGLLDSGYWLLDPRTTKAPTYSSIVHPILEAIAVLCAQY